MWPMFGQNAVFAGDPRGCAPIPHSALSQRLGSAHSMLPGLLGAHSTPAGPGWLSKVFADLWKLGGESYSAKVSSICSQPGDQMKRRCFYELQASGLP